MTFGANNAWRRTGIITLLIFVGRLVPGIVGGYTWVFGGWAEELSGISPPRLHKDVDLLYPAKDFELVDDIVRRSGLQKIEVNIFRISGRSC